MSCDMKIKTAVQTLSILRYNYVPRPGAGHYLLTSELGTPCVFSNIERSKKSPVTTNTILWICLLRGDKLGPSSGHNNTRKWIHIETEIIKQISRWTSKSIKNIYTKNARSQSKVSAPWRRYFCRVIGLAYLEDPECYAGGSVATGRASFAGQDEGESSEEERYPGSLCWGLRRWTSTPTLVKMFSS
jgi:hypothetical protein